MEEWISKMEGIWGGEMKVTEHRDEKQEPGEEGRIKGSNRRLSSVI